MNIFHIGAIFIISKRNQIFLLKEKFHSEATSISYVGLVVLMFNTTQSKLFLHIFHTHTSVHSLSCKVLVNTTVFFKLCLCFIALFFHNIIHVRLSISGIQDSTCPLFSQINV